MVKYKLAVDDGAFVCDEDGRPIQEPSQNEIKVLMESVSAHQDECRADAEDFLKFYFNDEKAIDISGMDQWLSSRQPLDRWFYVHLMEATGAVFVKRAYSAHKSAIALSKNKAPRAWCVEQWKVRTDSAQSKNAFSRVFSTLVKKQFGVVVTPDTIARAWLKGLK